MSTELTVVESTVTAPAMVDAKTTLDNAAKIATAIADVIEKQKLYTNIGGKKYVRVDAYIALGNVRGIYPREVRTTEHDDGTFESFVELVDRSGAVVGSGSAIVGADEPTWKNRPRFARRSMAITRATGKAFRIRDAWILTLAGYEGTPAEEMEHTVTNSTAGSSAAASTAADGYYQGREDQEKRLSEYLTKKEIAPEKQRIIKARMMNRHSSELEEIIAEVVKS